MRMIDEQPLLTTVAGSYPQEGLPARRAIQRAVEDQIAAGIDIIADGQVRGDMIGAFARHIPGLRQAPDGVWEVEAALDLPDAPITVADYVLARQLAGDRAEVKGVVTGPITLAISCRVVPGAPYAGPADPSLVLRLAEILAHEVAALVASGARVVQVDEPVLGATLGTRIAPELAHDALRDMAAMPHLAALHVCGDIRANASELLLFPFAVLAIENSILANLAAIDRDELDVTGLRLAVGCVSTSDPRIESVAEIRERIQAALEVVAPERLWLTPDCGLSLLPREVARQKLQHLATAVQDVRATL